MPKIFALLTAPVILVAGPQVTPPKIVSEVDAKALAEKTMAKFVAEQYKEGFDFLVPYWNAPKNELDTLVMQTIQQRSTVKPRYGASIGYEFIGMKSVGHSLLKLTYVEKLENTALRYTFIFYRPKNTWEFQGMVWDDKLSLLFGE